jgi:2-dehydro-3-deoxy-D-arabinonate dehydratase
MLMYQVIPVSDGLSVRSQGVSHLLAGASFDELFQQSEPAAYIAERLMDAAVGELGEFPSVLPAPIGTQEVWAAGVTYFRSREARMEESADSGGDRFYHLVYDADRPEIFFKATAPRVRGTGDLVRIREDATWSVPEPELVLAINREGKIFGYAIGNDMSSRDIEGENPLYLPQAKVYRGSCSLGPWLTVCEPLPVTTKIGISITRAGSEVFAGETTLSQLKRKPQELADWLFRENEFPVGAYLFTGTGVVPPGTWTVEHGDVVRIEIAGLGVLENTVE